VITRTDALNDALDRFGAYRYVDGVGFACHGPMGAETLSMLGHDDLVAGWAEDYKARHEPIDAPPPFARLDAAEEASWRPALGDPRRATDWAALFGDQLREEPWPAVVRRWAPRLLPGHAGGFTHGLIRVAHAVRAMPVDGPPSDLRVNELALGLAYWAATYTVIPGESRVRGTLTVDDAIAGLPRPDQPWSPFEAGTFARIGELGDFPAAVDAIGPPPSSFDDALSDLTAAFCRVLLAHPDVFPQGPVHMVTPIAATRILVPYLADVSHVALYTGLWRTGAAIVCGFLPPPAEPSPTPDPGVSMTPTPGEVIARAVENRDPHALKFAEACTREHARRPDPVYLRAAQHVIYGLPHW
jgi:Questin oxidase-like